MRWYVGFVPARNEWVQRLFAGRGKFAHCFAFRPVEGRWLVIDRTLWGLGAQVVSDAHAHGLIDTVRAKGSLLLAEPRTLKVIWTPPLVASCTETVKALLNIHNPLILTPRQLHCALLKSGAESF